MYVCACVNSCLLWIPPTVTGTGVMVGNIWDSSRCRAESHYVLRERFVQCTCTQLGAAAVSDDVGRGYNWTFPAGISTALCLLALVLAVTVHLVYRSGTLLASRLLICLCSSMLLFQVTTPTCHTHKHTNWPTRVTTPT